MNQYPAIDLIIDMQFGSTGKGLLAGHLAMTNQYDAVISCNMPNAGHTFVDEKGHIMVHKVLPNGAVNAKYILIGPGSVFSIARLQWEIERLREFGYLKQSYILVHEAATVLLDRHHKAEKGTLSHISSTMQGSAAAMIDKMSRDPKGGLVLAKHYKGEIEACHSLVQVLEARHWNALWTAGVINKVLAEGCQGFSLGINQGFWPYCTSRECTPYRMLSDMGLPMTRNITVWGACRTYPIRVGSLPGTTSGDGYNDQRETSWDNLGVYGIVPEYTTVTGRERRVFTWSNMQIEQAMVMCDPDHIFLNFCNYMTPSGLAELLATMPPAAEERVSLLGYGPKSSDIREYIRG